MKLWIVSKIGWKNLYPDIKKSIEEQFGDNYVVEDVIVPENLTAKWIEETFLKLVKGRGSIVFVHPSMVLLKYLACHACEHSVYVLDKVDGELGLY